MAASIRNLSLYRFPWWKTQILLRYTLMFNYREKKITNIKINIRWLVQRQHEFGGFIEEKWWKCSIFALWIMGYAKIMYMPNLVSPFRIWEDTDRIRFQGQHSNYQKEIWPMECAMNFRKKFLFFFFELRTSYVIFFSFMKRRQWYYYWLAWKHKLQIKYHQNYSISWAYWRIIRDYVIGKTE